MRLWPPSPSPVPPGLVAFVLVLGAVFAAALLTRHWLAAGGAGVALAPLFAAWRTPPPDDPDWWL